MNDVSMRIAPHRMVVEDIGIRPIEKEADHMLGRRFAFVDQIALRLAILAGQEHVTGGVAVQPSTSDRRRAHELQHRGCDVDQLAAAVDDALLSHPGPGDDEGRTGHLHPSVFPGDPGLLRILSVALSVRPARAP